MEALVLPRSRHGGFGGGGGGGVAPARSRTVGFDLSRFGMLSAVLQRSAPELLRGAELFVNIPGGLRALEHGERSQNHINAATISSDWYFHTFTMHKQSIMVRTRSHSSLLQVLSGQCVGCV